MGDSMGPLKNPHLVILSYICIKKLCIRVPFGESLLHTLSRQKKMMQAIMSKENLIYIQLPIQTQGLSVLD